MPVIIEQTDDHIKIEIGSDTSASIYEVDGWKNPERVNCNCLGYKNYKYCKHLKYCKSILDQFFNPNNSEKSGKEINDFDQWVDDHKITAESLIINWNTLALKRDLPYLTLAKKPNRYVLSKNLISVLFKVYKLSRNEGFVRCKDMKGFLGVSGSALLTQLKYFDAIDLYFSAEDKEKLSKRSGKWCVTVKGIKFLTKQGTLPARVVIQSHQVIKKDDEIFIDDPELKWKTEEDIWIDLLTFWEEMKE